MNESTTPKSSPLAVVCALLVLGAGFAVWSWFSHVDPSLRHDASVVAADGTIYTVEIADSETERELGLSFLPSLRRDQGKLFLFPKSGRPVFWMKDMRFSIDILWLQNGVVVDKVERAPLPGLDGVKGFVPEADADTVLELVAGEADAHKISLGSRLDIRLPDGYTAPTN